MATIDLELCALTRRFFAEAEASRRRLNLYRRLEETCQPVLGDVSSLVRHYSAAPSFGLKLADLATDLMHLADAHRLDFEKVLTVARENYRREAGQLKV